MSVVRWFELDLPTAGVGIGCVADCARLVRSSWNLKAFVVCVSSCFLLHYRVDSEGMREGLEVVVGGGYMYFTWNCNALTLRYVADSPQLNPNTLINPVTTKPLCMFLK